MNKVPHISIILPVYNAEKTLQKCIKSILKQDFIDFELIIINDGSDDDTLFICKNYAEKDNRIELISQSNKGVSSARNIGLDKAKGKYICFVDADDWAEQGYLSAFFRYNIIPNKEIVIQSCYESSDKETSIKCILPDKLYNQTDFTSIFTELHILGYGYPFAKLYQTDIIKKYNLRFDTNIHFIEDLLFFLNYFQHMESVRTVSEAHYYYTVHTSEISLSYSHNQYDSEIKAYYSEKKILETLTTKFNLSNSAIEYWKTNNGFLFYRAIRTIYRPQWKEIFSERIKILKEQWNKENIYCLKAYSKQFLNEKLNRIAIMLYANKHIYIYDLYMNFFIFLRYRIPFLWKVFRKLVRPKKHNTGIL